MARRKRWELDGRGKGAWAGRGGRVGGAARRRGPGSVELQTTFNSAAAQTPQVRWALTRDDAAPRRCEDQAAQAPAVYAPGRERGLDWERIGARGGMRDVSDERKAGSFC